MRSLSHAPRLIRWILAIGLIFLVLMSLMRFGFYFYFHDTTADIFQLKEAFFLGIRYDLRVIGALLLVMLIIGSFSPMDPFRSKAARHFWIIFLSVAALVLVIFYVADFLHYSYLKQRLNASVLNYLQDAGISSEMIWSTYPVIRAALGIMFISLILIILIRRTYDNIYKLNLRPSRKTRTIFFVACVLVFGLMIFGRVDQYPLRWSDAFSLGSDYKASLALNPCQSFLSTLKFRNSSYDLEKVKSYRPVVARHYGISASDESLARVVSSATSAKAIRPNVILILCESFSAYKSSMWGNPLNTTPYFDSLCRQGIFFDRCFTPTYGTAKGVWATLTGIPDVSDHSTATRNPLAVDQHVIINSLTDYQKYYFIGGSASWANIRGILTNNVDGLKLYEEEDFKAPRVDVWGISDKNLLMESSKVLAGENRPFFAIIQTAGNHRPYSIPKEDLGEFNKVTLPNDSLRKYGFESLAELNAFRYTDYFFQKFIESARTEKYFDNTIFVFVGDHGIAGNAGAMFPRAWTDHRLTSLHVPLLFYAPKLFGHRRIDRVCSQIDVLPTAIGLCGREYVNTTLGRDLLDSSTSSKEFAFVIDPDYRQTGVVDRHYSYRKNLTTGEEELLTISGNNAPSPQQALFELRQLNDALYHTSKFLLLNNRKKGNSVER